MVITFYPPSINLYIGLTDYVHTNTYILQYHDYIARADS